MEETAPAEDGETPAQEAASAEDGEATAQEAAPAENTEASAQEAAPADEAVEQKPEKKLTPGKLALIIAAIVVVLGAIIALGVVNGNNHPVETIPESAPVEITEAATTEATIPADGNPDDETCKGTYTADNDAVKANADTVVATVGDHQLTNSQLQVFYWMQVQSFLSSDYGSYMMYYGMLDYSQPLDT